MRPAVRFLILARIHYNYFGHDEWRESHTAESLEGADSHSTRGLRPLERAENIAASDAADTDESRH